MERRIAVVGLGYVGLPVAVAFARRGRVIGFDISTERVKELRAGRDRTGEVKASDLAAERLQLTDDPAALRDADFIIVAVPTPIDGVNRPDLSLLIRASETVGAHLRRGAVVVYESTVYPGVTDDICIPILERASGMVCGPDFKVGYSPERINPGDCAHAFENITKIISGVDEEALEVIAAVYGEVVQAGVYRAPNIRTAEAAKVIENTQRDLNIALMNELAMIFHRLDLDTAGVLEAAGTKWNFLPFRPGLVGGHCIGVDPYYLTCKAEQVGYHPQVILAGRRINDGMGKYVAEQVVKLLIQQEVNVRQAHVAVLGLAFKENVPDIRNSKVVDIVRELNEYGLQTHVHDPLISAAEAEREYGIRPVSAESLRPADAVILAVPHRCFCESGAVWIGSLLRRQERGVVVDVKSVFNGDEFGGALYWRL